VNNKFIFKTCTKEIGKSRRQNKSVNHKGEFQQYSCLPSICPKFSKKQFHGGHQNDVSLIDYSKEHISVTEYMQKRK
jgi:hypothetical protein